ncbi:transporter substrate-binding domain-containing protein [Shewanella sp. VB17]|uniref:transporter substrate-binding domain-containing protein n=1 Tax=Shewanella sp. VB17 TaxID=2739432 RepID=UPI001563F972|nr:transporter substrate-binding domain-containing protein [Shewanella sp. VB17]NRD74503.1 transporter substrate-binding domain-containing protein [Shewanella sp. VB17]
MMKWLGLGLMLTHLFSLESNASEKNYTDTIITTNKKENKANTLNPIIIAFNIRVPIYLEPKSGQDHPEGTVGTPASQALKNTNLNYEWQNIPFSRVMKMIEGNMTKICNPSLFKTEERLKFSKYSNMVYQDKEILILSYKNHPTLKDNLTLEQLLSSGDFKLLAKQGYSYGNRYDEIIKHNEKNNVTRVITGNYEIIKMLLKKRSDFMFIDPTELDGIFIETDITPEQVQTYSIKDAPEGNKRYFMCSKKVSNEEINEINKGLKINRLKK